MGLITFALDISEAHSLLHSQPRPLVRTHNGMHISKWTYTVIHVCDMPLGGPHTRLHKAVARLPHPVTGSGRHPQAIAHTQMVPQSWIRSTDTAGPGTRTRTGGAPLTQMPPVQARRREAHPSAMQGQLGSVRWV